MPTLRAFLLDFDGTLADTEGLHFAAFAEVLSGVGISISRAQYDERYLGLPDREGLETAMATAGREHVGDDLPRLLERKARRMAEKLERGVPLYPGAGEFVAQAAIIGPLAIVSGALRAEIDLVIRRSGLEPFFTTIVAAEDATRGKPDPEGFALAWRTLRDLALPDLELDECLAIEDSPHGIRAARAAGVRVLAVAHTRPAGVLFEADLVVRSFAEARRGLGAAEQAQRAFALTRTSRSRYLSARTLENRTLRACLGGPSGRSGGFTRNGTMRRCVRIIALLVAGASFPPAAGTAEMSSISGIVTNESGAALREVCVAAVAEPDFDELVAEALTGDDGRYVLTDLPPGRYKVGFFDCAEPVRYVGEWFDDHLDLDDADLVSVAAGDTKTGIDAVLALGGGIAGAVTDATTSKPLEFICVGVFSEDGGALRGFAVTDESGLYGVGGLPAAGHRVLFFDCRDLFPIPSFECTEDPAYVAEWYDDARTLQDAAIVAVTPPDVTAAIDAALDSGVRADLAIQEIAVERLPMLGPDRGDTGLRRRARVTIANLGQRTANPNAMLFARLCGDNGCLYFDVFELLGRALAPGETVERTYEWDASDAIGDVELIVEILVDRDADCSNNIGTAEDSMILPKTGVGAVY